MSGTVDRKWLAGIYGVDVAGTRPLAILPCGARLCLIGDESTFTVALRLSPLAAQGQVLRDGDAALLCPHGCISFFRCPLVEKYIGIDSVVELEAFVKGLVDKFKAGDGDGNLPGVRDHDGCAPEHLSVPIRLRCLVIKLHGELHFVIPPMAKVVDEGDDSGRAGRTRSEAD